MEINNLKNLIGHNCFAILLITDEDFSEKTPYFFELNYFFDGLLTELIRTHFKHQAINIFKTQSYDHDLTLIAATYEKSTWENNKKSILENFLKNLDSTKTDQPKEILLIDPFKRYPSIKNDLTNLKINFINLN